MFSSHLTVLASTSSSSSLETRAPFVSALFSAGLLFACVVLWVRQLEPGGALVDGFAWGRARVLPRQ